MPIVHLTLPEKLVAVVKQGPHKVALQLKKQDSYDKYTYQDLYYKAYIIGQALITLGVQKSERIAIVLENRPEWVFIYFGILLAGAIAVPLDPQSTSHDLTYFFADSTSKIVFTSLPFQAAVTQATLEVKSLQKIVLLDAKPLAPADARMILFTELMQGFYPALEPVKVLPNDVAAILYTSGTTGSPKGVMLTHANLYANFHSIDQLKIFNHAHNVLALLPLHHSFPLMVTLIIPLFTHNTITYIGSNKQEEILKCMQEAKITLFVGVPQLFYLFSQRMLAAINSLPVFKRLALRGLVNLCHQIRRITKLNLNKLLLTKIHALFGQHLSYFLSGGAKLDEQVELFLNKMGFTLIQGYGLTETAPIVTFNPINKIKRGSVGTAIPEVKLKIIKPTDSLIGEIVISGPNVMKGYYQREQETQAVLQDGWFYSGDLGYLDKQGYLFITDRKKELIVLNTGKNVSPGEVEAHYATSHYIKELCVILVGAGAQEKLAAVIVPNFEFFKKVGELDLLNTLKFELETLSKNYPEYKCIRGFVITKEPLPRTPLGKLKRHEIRHKYLEELLGVKPHISKEEALTGADLAILSSLVYKIVATLISTKKQLKEPIQLHYHLNLDLGFDSLSRIELIAALEKQFNIHIPEPLSIKVATVKELTLIVDKLINEQQPQSIATIISTPAALWQDILNTNPAKEMIAKLDITPSWLAKAAYLFFSSGIYLTAKLMWRLKIIGANRLLPKQPLILCANHNSYLDAFLVLAALPSWLKLHIFFLGYSVYFNAPVIRNFVKISRTIPINAATNLVDTMQVCGYILRHGRSLCIFPEGGRSIDSSLQPFKKGVGILAHELNIPLVPVYIDGSFEVLPRGKIFPSWHQIKVIFGNPVWPAQLQAQGMSLGAKDSYEAIAKGIQEEVAKLATSQHS